MNTRNLIIYTLILLSFNAFSQRRSFSGEVVYEVKMKIDEEKLKRVSKSIGGSGHAKESAISILKDQNKVNYIMLFNKNESIFKKQKELEINENKINLVKILVGKGVFYSNKTINKILNQKEAFGELFLIDLPKLKWKVTQETKKIGNYTCYKATTEKKGENRKGKFVNKVSAWYTPEISTSFGPKDYSGLPGLILELNEGNLIFNVSKINVSIKKEISIKKPSKGKEITLGEYNKKVKEIANKIRK